MHTDGIIVLTAAVSGLLGYVFGCWEATACRQRAAFAEAKTEAAMERITQLTAELEDARKRQPTTVGFDDSLGGVAE